MCIFVCVVCSHFHSGSMSIYSCTYKSKPLYQGPLQRRDFMDLSLAVKIDHLNRSSSVKKVRRGHCRWTWRDRYSTNEEY